MTLTFNPAPDWSVVDGQETVSLYVRISTDAFDDFPVTVTNALGRAPTRSEMDAAGGLVTDIGRVWHLWSEKLLTTVPKIRDVIRDSTGARWTILKVDKQTMGTRYMCTTKKER